MFVPDASQMLVNISSNIPSLIRLTTATIYVLGMYIVATSIAALRNAPIIHAPAQGQTSAWVHLKHIFIGAALIYFTSSVGTATATLLGKSDSTMPYSYLSSSINPFSDVITSAFLVLELIGVIAIGKGIYELGYGHGTQTMHGHHHGPVSKGLTFIFGGALCINIHAFLLIIFNTLGISGILN